MLRPVLVLGSLTVVVLVAACGTSGDELFGEADGAGLAPSAGGAGPGGPGSGAGTASGDPQSASSAGGAGPGPGGPGPGGAGPGPGPGGAGPGGAGVGGKNEGGAPPDDIGCSDGTREYFANIGNQPDIAGCDGGFQVPSTTSPDSMQPQCDRHAGNDGNLPEGDGCSVEDLCAKGWHVCQSDDDVAAHSSDGECEPFQSENMFYLTRQSQDEMGACVSNAVNNLVGCGSMGDFSPANCNPLSRYMRYMHCIPSSTWYCGNSVPDGSHEADLVAKLGPEEGGVLCCRD